MLEGAELHGRKENSVCPCRILKVVEKDVDNISYEVGWLDKNKKVTGTSIVKAVDLLHKKLPFSRDVLKSFIRESTSRSTPWVVHEKLARKYGISTEPPEELQEKKSIRDGYLSRNEQRRKNKDAENGVASKNKRRKLEKQEKPKEEPIKYPIDDLLVQPGVDDPDFTVRPSPMRDFRVPMDCVGDLLMVWDFCTSFSRLLHLWPFSLEDFENAICHKDSDLIIIMESHSAILRLLIKDEGEYFTTIQKRRRKRKITLMNWSEYLCDFLEMKDVVGFSSRVGMIKRGHYGLLDPEAKFSIFRELVSEALLTDAIRQKLDEYIEEWQALGASKREEAIEEARKKRIERKNHNEAERDSKGLVKEYGLENGERKLHNSENNCTYGQNGYVPRGKELFSSNGKHASSNRKSKHDIAIGLKQVMKQRMGKKNAENMEESSSGDYLRKAPGGMNKRAEENQEKSTKEKQEKSTKEQRKERFEREIEKRFIRTTPLGKDRDYNRYWFFRRDGRIFVESCDSKQWGYYTAKEELDALMGSLNPKGEREQALQKQLEKYYLRLCNALQKRSKDMTQKIALEEAVVRRSTRVQSKPKDSPTAPFLRYVNKWKEG